GSGGPKTHQDARGDEHQQGRGRSDATVHTLALFVVRSSLSVPKHEERGTKDEERGTKCGTHGVSCAKLPMPICGTKCCAHSGATAIRRRRLWRSCSSRSRSISATRRFAK